MSQDPKDLITGLDIFTDAQKYVREYMEDWPRDKDDEDHIGFWPRKESVLIVPKRNVYDNHIHYTSTIATNCSKLHEIPGFQAKTDALPNFNVLRTNNLTEMELRDQEYRWVLNNSQNVCASQQDFMQCLRKYKPKVSVYSDISDTAFEQLSAREDTKLYYQSQAESTTLNQGAALLENNQTQAAESEADVAH